MQRLELEVTTTAVDGKERTVIVATDNRDRVRWEMEARRQSWPATATDAPFTWSTYMAYAALKRTNQIPQDMDFDGFNNATLDVVSRTVEVNPTPAGAANI